VAYNNAWGWQAPAGDSASSLVMAGASLVVLALSMF
jgi:hypothetical protein